MADDVQKGHAEAHTPGSSGAAMAIEGDDGGGLFDHAIGLADLEGSDGLSAAAELVAAERRARGRPIGSLNKRNSKLFDYLAARGHRHPAVTLSMWQAADTKVLAKALGADTAKGRLAVAALQVRAAAELLPYDMAKRPQQLEIPDAGNGRPVMVIGEMNVMMAADLGMMSAGEKPNEINGDIVRQKRDPHEG